MNLEQPHLHFNCLYGAAGDMILASLIDLGADGRHIERVLRTLVPEIQEASFSEVMRGGMRGLYLTIRDSSQCVSEHAHAHAVEDGGRHDHAHTHVHGHHHSHQTHVHRHHGPHRHLADMLELVDRSDTSAAVRERAKRVFQLLAEAEGHIHGKPPTEVHFHELSGVDTIVDVLGTCIAVDMLGITGVSASVVTTGHGTLRCDHGTFTVPAPATLEIISKRGMPCRPGDIEAELLTPTGAALLATLVSEFGPAPAMRMERVGYGAGSYASPEHPNLLQAILGRKLSEPA